MAAARDNYAYKYVPREDCLPPIAIVPGAYANETPSVTRISYCCKLYQRPTSPIFYQYDTLAQLYNYFLSSSPPTNKRHTTIIYTDVTPEHVITQFIAEFEKRRTANNTTPPELRYLQRPFAHLCRTHFVGFSSSSAWGTGSKYIYVHGLTVLTYTLLRLFKGGHLYDQSTLRLLFRTTVWTISDGQATTVLDMNDCQQATASSCLMPWRNELPPASSDLDYLDEYKERVQYLLRYALLAATEAGNAIKDYAPILRRSGFARIVASWFIEEEKDDVSFLGCIHKQKRIAQATLDALETETPLGDEVDSDPLLWQFIVATRHLTLDYTHMATYWEEWYSPFCTFTRVPECLHIAAVHQIALKTAMDGMRRRFSVAEIQTCSDNDTHLTLEEELETVKEHKKNARQVVALLHCICCVVGNSLVTNTASAHAHLTSLPIFADLIINTVPLRMAVRRKFRKLVAAHRLTSKLLRNRVLDLLRTMVSAYYASAVKRKQAEEKGTVVIPRPLPINQHVKKHLIAQYGFYFFNHN